MLKVFKHIRTWGQPDFIAALRAGGERVFRVRSRAAHGHPSIGRAASGKQVGRWPAGWPRATAGRAAQGGARRRHHHLGSLGPRRSFAAGQRRLGSPHGCDHRPWKEAAERVFSEAAVFFTSKPQGKWISLGLEIRMQSFSDVTWKPG